MMPVYNEERALETIIGHVLEPPEVGELIAVDHASSDRSWEVLKRVAGRDSRVRPFRLDVNQGEGAALRRAVLELRLPFALVRDADLEYRPQDYPKLLEPLVQERAEVVFGTRGFAGQTAFSFWFVMASR